jgi:hypothetical protein
MEVDFDIFNCPICFEALASPKTLSDGRAYCSGCISAWFSDREKRSESPATREAVDRLQISSVSVANMLFTPAQDRNRRAKREFVILPIDIPDQPRTNVRNLMLNLIYLRMSTLMNNRVNDSEEDLSIEMFEIMDRLEDGRANEAEDENEDRTFYINSFEFMSEISRPPTSDLNRVESAAVGSINRLADIYASISSLISATSRLGAAIITPSLRAIASGSQLALRMIGTRLLRN